MGINHKYLPAAMSLGLVTGLSAPASAMTTIELLTMGDSITFGSESDTSGDANPSSPDDDLGGYRFYLDRDIENFSTLSYADFDFVGSRDDGLGITAGPDNFADSQHFGVRGARAQSETTLSGNYVPSMLTGISNVVDDPTSINAAFNPAFNTPDAVLLGIGINRLVNRREADLASGSDIDDRIENTIDRAFNGFVTMLDGDDGSSRNDGNTGPRTGLVDRFTDNSLFANDAHLFVAMILPRMDDLGGDDNPGNGINNDGITVSRAPSMVADYNSRVKTELLSRMGPGDDLEGRVTFVDLFSISLDELDLVALADEFFAGVTLEDTPEDRMNALLAAINPEAEGGTLETDYVDWVAGGPGHEFDEGAFDNGTYTADDLVDPGGQNENFELMRDALHPTNLGYAITAQVWANALESHYGVPEPSALSLLAVGGLLLAGRRRRRA